jgi:hypothetical protein
MDNYKH